MHNDLDSGRHAGREEARKEQARIEGGREGARRDGGGSEGSRGREEVMMLGRERASVEEGRVEGGWVDKGMERGMDSTREIWEGGSEWRRD